jgi:hypothetical protein
MGLNTLKAEGAAPKSRGALKLLMDLIGRLEELSGTELRLCFCDFAGQNKFPS